MTASRFIPAAAIAALLALTAATQAHAAPGAVACGATITQDTTLTADLTNCPGEGHVIGADGITLDLNGHTIDGTVAQATSCDEPSFGNDGIDLGGHDRLTVVDGTV